LPEHWRCPNCDGDAEQFMVIDEPVEWQHGPAQQAQTLCAHFQDIADTRVRGLPFLNQQLVVEAVGFSAQIAGENAATGVLGILITPGS
jgi:phage terminase large subunit GpA-like protein